MRDLIANPAGSCPHAVARPGQTGREAEDLPGVIS